MIIGFAIMDNWFSNGVGNCNNNTTVVRTVGVGTGTQTTWNWGGIIVIVIGILIFFVGLFMMFSDRGEKKKKVKKEEIEMEKPPREYSVSEEDFRRLQQAKANEVIDRRLAERSTPQEQIVTAQPVVHQTNVPLVPEQPMISPTTQPVQTTVTHHYDSRDGQPAQTTVTHHYDPAVVHHTPVQLRPVGADYRGASLYVSPSDRYYYQ